MFKFLVIAALLALATYLLVRMIERRAELMGAPRRPTTKPMKPKRTRPVAPDDDEEFLRELDRKRLNPEDPDQP